MKALLVLLVMLPGVSAAQTALPVSPDSLATLPADSALGAGEARGDSLLPSRVESLLVADAPHDAGGAIDLFWTLSLDEGVGDRPIAGYEVLRATSRDGPFTTRAVLGPGTDRFRDRTAREGTPFYYVIRVRSSTGATADSKPVGPVRSRGQWFDVRRIPVLGGLVVILFVLAVTRTLPPDQEWVLPAVRTVAEILKRPRSKPLVFVPGTGGVGDMATIASLTLLDQVARLTEDTGPGVVVYTANALAHSLAVEQLPGADVRFVCPDPMVFSMAFTGEAMRDRPDAGFVVGEMGSESFLMAEAMRRSGGVVVGGTVDVTETPFLVATCDLTFIGEEIFLTGVAFSPGGCRAAAVAHDRLKVLVWLLILVGVAAAKYGVSWYIKLFGAGVD